MKKIITIKILFIVLTTGTQFIPALCAQDCAEQTYNALLKAFTVNTRYYSDALPATALMSLSDLQNQLVQLQDHEKRLNKVVGDLQKQMETFVAQKNYQQAVDTFIQMAQQGWIMVSLQNMLTAVKAQLQRMTPTP